VRIGRHPVPRRQPALTACKGAEPTAAAEPAGASTSDPAAAATSKSSGPSCPAVFTGERVAGPVRTADAPADAIFTRAGTTTLERRPVRREQNEAERFSAVAAIASRGTARRKEARAATA